MGINRNTDNDAAANHLTSYGKTLPWLQDTQTNVWRSWGAEYRDVIIVDSSNRVVNVLNLTFNDLGQPANKERLKGMLRSAANAGDSDGDSLPDHWEHRYLNGLSGQRAEDPDEDGFDNFVELAFGSNPQDASEFPMIEWSFNASRQFTVTFNRWAGEAADYRAEGSTNMVQWTASTQLIRGSTATLYDGTGRSRAAYSFVRNRVTQPRGFIRVNASEK